MGRTPKTLTEEQRTQVEALAAYLSQDQIADYFGTTRTTFAAMMEREPEISVRYKRGKAKAIGHVAQGLLQKARSGDTTSAIFYLKTQAGWRETTHLDLSNEDGTLSTIDTTKLTTEQKKALLAAMVTNEPDSDEG